MLTLRQLEVRGDPELRSGIWFCVAEPKRGPLLLSKSERSESSKYIPDAFALLTFALRKLAEILYGAKFVNSRKE